jgi:hypothetical protein
MRRLAVLALAVLPLAACSGEQGERAQQLLTRAQVAQARLHSAEFEARIAFTMDGKKFSLVMDGGGYFKGPRTGDALLKMRTDGVPGSGAVNMQLVVRRGHATMSLNGQTFSAPGMGFTKQQYDWSSAVVDLARYVKKVKVREGRVAGGEPGVTVAGVLDTKELIKAGAKLDALTRGANLSDFSGKIGDIHAAVFISTRTGLIRSAVLTMSMEAEGKKADVELTYRLKSTNRVVAGL